MTLRDFLVVEGYFYSESYSMSFSQEEYDRFRKHVDDAKSRGRSAVDMLLRGIPQGPTMSDEKLRQYKEEGRD